MTTTREKITLSVAAKALGVSVRTVQRYLDKGLITKIKEDGKVYVLSDEIRSLRQNSETTKKTTDDARKKGKTTVTVDMSYLEGLLVQLGEMKEKQRLLLEYKDDIRQKDNVIVAKDQKLIEQRTIIDQKNKELSEAEKILASKNKAMQQAGEKIRELQEENERLKTPWWKRLWKK